MSGAYRGIVAALVGWLVLTGANHADIKAEREQAQAKNAIAEHLGNLSSAYETERAEKAKAPKETGPCGEREYRGNADLCAQWKAADSASDSAWWAWASGITGIVSVAGIVVALGLTIWSNWIARDTARRQLRAYLAVKPAGINLLIGSRKVIGQIALENAGTTPAYNVSLSVQMDVCDEKGRTIFDFSEDVEKTDRTVHPGLQMPQGSRNNPNLSTIDSPGKYAYVWGVAYYNDAFGKRRFTRFCHRYSTSSRDQIEILKRTQTIKASIQSIVAIAADKARYHPYGNEAS
jgi:hypothetical protein